MKPLRLVVLLIYIFLLPVLAFAQEKYSKIVIYPVSGEQRVNLIGLLEIDHFIEAEGGLVTELSESGVNTLKMLGVKYKVLIDDVAKNLQRQNEKFFAARRRGIDLTEGRVAIEQPGGEVNAIIKTPADFKVQGTFGGYYSFAQMEAAMDVLVSKYPAIAQKISIGKTAEGRNLWLIKISDNVATDELNEPEVLYMGLQHAREAITGSSMIFFMQYLCENYATDKRIKDLVDNREIYIIPCFNPDGWEYNRSTNPNGGGGWRKNRNPVDSTVKITPAKGKQPADTTVTYNAFGVDLNRNWGVDWGNCSAPILGPSTSCGSSTKTSDTYYGSSAFSELETQAVRDFAKAHHLVAGFDQHAYGPYYSLPYGRKSLHKEGLPEKAQNFFTAIPALMGTYNGMRAADSYDALGYEVAGGFKDWMLTGELGVGSKDTVWAMTGEGAAGGGSGGTFSDFWAPASQIEYLSKGMCYQNLQLAFAAGTYVDVQDASDIALNSLSGNLSFTVKRLGLGNDPVKVSLVPLENIKTAGGPVTINNMVYYGNYNGSISYSLFPNITNGQRVRFAWKVETGGYSYSDTIVKFYNPTELLYDDMEGSFATNWKNTASGTPASGFGYNYTAGNWDFTTSGGYNSNKALSESPANTNYSSSSIRICESVKTFDLRDASAAYLSFWTRYRAENFRDKLQVQVSTDGATWQAIAGKFTVQEATTKDGSTLSGQPAFTGVRDYWSQEMFNLGAYIGKAAALRLRFVFTSDNDPSTFKFEVDDGFYIDNLKVVKSTASMVVLPVKFLNFYGKLLKNNYVQLDWEAETDLGHDYFEVERSANGSDFISLGRSNPFPPYQFIDKSAQVGNNFYRIKQYDKDGHFTYSKIINVTVQPDIQLLLYPNPATDMLNVELESREAGLLKLQVTDLQGRIVYSNVGMSSQFSYLKIDASSWKPQLYILRVINSKNEVLMTQKFTRL